MRRRRIAQGASLVGTVALLLGVGATSASARPINESQGFRKAVTVAGIREHQLALQQIADANGGNRAVGTPGYDASVAYIVGRAEAAGYEVTLDEFTYVEDFCEGSAPVLEEIAPEPQVFVAGSRPAFDGDFVSFTGTGDVTAPVQASTWCCRPAPPRTRRPADARPRTSPASFPGNIALIQRGTCPYVQKAAMAQEAGRRR